MIDNSRTISMHDQYLTASPWDDCPDFSDEPWFVKCPKCGSESFSETGGDYPNLDFKCDDCSHEWGQNVNKPYMTNEQNERLEKLQKQLSEIQANRTREKGSSVDEFFDSLGIEGDFNWDGMEAGDWHVYCCGEKDCDQQWHLAAYAETIGRENGKRYIELHSVDSDGNWDYDTGYDERENDDPSYFKYVSEIMANRNYDFFIGWAEYWLDAAETGNDPCEQCLNPDKIKNWVDFCLDAVEKNIKYLLM